MWMWSSELARLRGPDNKSNMKFAMNPNVPTKLDCALSWAVVWEAQSGVSQSLHYNHRHFCCCCHYNNNYLLHINGQMKYTRNMCAV